ncbi:hypothetical protein MXD62_31445 [Frankia sp. Mgl5]|uniref:hypothetical protein n=1 Tax=Frankia sp. Mgl5 TaxID=2933793 RepID=UPI002010202E|nr:hypothetical protein [Frankia sp. Mgl5]MCK9931601.1 hypothetical protein [Frankia sp. Mgl5]
MQSGAAFGWTVDYILECAVGKPGGTSQKHPAPARRVGATEIDIAQQYVDRQIAGRLSPVDTAKARWRSIEL